jgi:site-specific DNA recombinase
VREVLHRELYHGVRVWNKTRKRTSLGQSRRTAKPETEWITVPVPELRIVSEDLWLATQARIAKSREAYVRWNHGQLQGRPPQSAESKYLLTGLVRCDVCGGSVYVKSRSHGQRRAFFYGCTSYHLRGKTACSNGIEVPMESTNRLILDKFESDILRPEHVERVIRNVVTRRQPSVEEREARRADALSGMATAQREVERLTVAITAGGDLMPLVTALKVSEARRQALKGELAGLSAIADIDVSLFEAEARQRLTEWRSLLLQIDVVPKSRQMLKKLLVGSLRARPVDEDGVRGWALTGQGHLGKLLAGIVGANMVASPTGFEPVF